MLRFPSLLNLSVKIHLYHHLNKMVQLKVQLNLQLKTKDYMKVRRNKRHKMSRRQWRNKMRSRY